MAGVYRDRDSARRPKRRRRLHAIAVAAKAHWGFDAAWMAEWARRVRITPEYLAGSLAFVAIEAGVIVRWYALLPRPPAALLDHPVAAA